MEPFDRDFPDRKFVAASARIWPTGAPPGMRFQEMIDAVENIVRGHRAGLRDQEVLGRSLALGRAHALAAMHAARHAGDFGIGMAQHRIVVARIDD